MKNSNGLTLLETILAMSMLAIVMAGGTTISNSSGWLTVMTRTSIQSHADLNQIFLMMEQDIKSFAYTNGQLDVPAVTTSGGKVTLRINSITTGNWIQYDFKYPGITNAELKRTSNLTTDQVLYQNVAGKYPVLLPFAAVDKDYNGDTKIDKLDGDLINICTDPSRGTSCPGSAKLIFDADSSPNGIIIKLSFRVLNQTTNAGNKKVLGKGSTKAIFLHV